ncbi:condensation domain-containing protein, partial [Streptomyces noursei]|uniref:condensation domain-containing protein n=1 Tax=Streptomyces noursei TaxID=1971 RepID=UPI0030F28FFC
MSAQENRLPLTAAQRGLWSLQQLDPANPCLVIGEFLDIQGSLDLSLFKAAVRQVVREAESLRLRVVADSDGVHQVVMDEVEVDVPVIDLRAEADPRGVAQQRMEALAAERLDLTRELPVAFHVFRLADDRFLHFHRFHHMAADGFSFSLLARRMAEVYTCLLLGDPCPPSPFRPFRELVSSDAAYDGSEEERASAEFWRRELAGMPEPARLSSGLPGIPRELLRRTAHLSESAARRLRALAESAGVRGSSVAIAAVALYIQRMTGAEEPVLGLPVTTRTEPAMREVPGMATNIVPLRIAPGARMTVAEVLRYSSSRVRAVLPHQRYRQENLQRDLQMVGTDHQLFGPNVNIMGFEYGLQFGEATYTGYNLAMGPTQDLSIAFMDRDNGEGWRIGLEANGTLYGDSEVEEHLDRLIHLLEVLSRAEPDLPVGELRTLTEADERALASWNATDEEVRAATTGEVFAVRAAKCPQAPALIDAAGDTVL